MGSFFIEQFSLEQRQNKPYRKILFPEIGIQRMCLTSKAHGDNEFNELITY